MARKIRFPIKMKNGAEVRTLDELKENFDLESVLGYFTDGRLATWLSDRYYDEKAEAVAALSADTPDLNAKLCEILEVEYEAEADETDVELIARRREKFQIISGVTDNREILDNIDRVAMDQDELFDILDESPEKIYLYGDKFEIPFGKKNISYIGINAPLVVLEKEKGIYLYKKNDIKFSNVKFEDTINPDFAAGERLFLKGRFQEAFPLIKEAAENGNPRAMYIMARYCNDGYETVTINNKERNNWCEKAYSYKEPLSMYGYAAWCLNDKQDEKNKLYSQIFNDIKFLAESGDALAQGIIGWMYDTGHGVEKDETKAVEWYRKAAEQGYAYAQNNLGTMYLNGKGVTQDYAEALKWYHKSAEQGYVRAQCNLGYMYRNGKGVTQDYAEAVEWYRKAAEQGYAYAQNSLGGMCWEGEGVARNRPEAVEWYRKAAEQGYTDAQYRLGSIYYNGSYGISFGSDSSIEHDYTKAVKWLKKAAEQGYAKAQDELGKMYQFGNGVAQDYEEAIKWYRKAAEQGYISGQYHLGIMYENGYGVAKDKSMAIEWYRKAAKQGNIHAKAILKKWGITI